MRTETIATATLAMLTRERDAALVEIARLKDEHAAILSRARGWLAPGAPTDLKEDIDRALHGVRPT
jgi:hypothetical protein